jgi:hypothetical protein
MTSCNAGTLIRYVVEPDVSKFVAEGWTISAFYAWRGAFAVFLMVKEGP